MVSIAKRLRDLREDHDEKQSEIAKLLRVPAARISEWETGKYTPRIDTLIILADHWQVSLDYLCGVSDNPRRA